MNGSPALGKRYGPLRPTVSRKEKLSTHEVDEKRQAEEAGEVRGHGRYGIS